MLFTILAKQKVNAKGEYLLAIFLAILAKQDIKPKGEQEIKPKDELRNAQARKVASEVDGNVLRKSPLW